MKKLNIKHIIFISTLLSIIIPYKVQALDNGWAIENNQKYYYENGNKVKGFKNIDEKIYFFSNVNYALKSGLQVIDNCPFYLNEDGTVYHGWKSIDGKTYYFGDDHFAIKGFNEIEGKTYFFSNVNYALKSGLQVIDNCPFYLNEDGTVYYGWKNIDGKTYYFGDAHFAIKGFNEIEGKTYFFSDVDYTLEKGWQYINDKIFYLNNAGEVSYGWQNIEGKTYYFGNDGFALNGFQELDGKIYFFSNINYSLKKGWQSMDNNYWYQDETGALVLGNQTILGRDYYFNETTGYLEGFKKDNEKLYYYNPDGTQAKGIQHMVDRFWKFDEETGEFEAFVNQYRVIDVSAHQGIINWDAVKSSGQVDAVILRIGYGSGYIDKYFVRNKNELERLGIPYSVYLFSYAENEAEALLESNFLIEAIRNNDVHIASNLLSIYYDLEDWTIKSTGENSYGISQDSYGKIITTFIDNTEKNLCIKTRIYSSKNYIENRFPSYARNYVTWIAQWNDKLTYEGEYEGWQYTSNGTVPGIEGRVDMNLFYN